MVTLRCVVFCIVVRSVVWCCHVLGEEDTRGRRRETVGGDRVFKGNLQVLARGNKRLHGIKRVLEHQLLSFCNIVGCQTSLYVVGVVHYRLSIIH